MKQTIVQHNYEELRKHIQNYSKSSNFKAWITISYTLLVHLFVWILVRFEYPILAYSLHALNTVRLFIIFHDMAHYSFFSSLSLNTYVGKIFGLQSHFPFGAWRDGHNHHHKHFGNLDRKDFSQTILFTKKQYEELKGIKKLLVRFFREPIIFFFVSVPFAWYIGLYALIIKRYGIFSWNFLQKIVGDLIYIFILPLLGFSLVGIWVGHYFGLMIGVILFHLQHSVNQPYRQYKTEWNFSKAAIQGSTFVKIPFFMKFFTAGIEYHHIHHFSTHVPLYEISQCHYSLENQAKDQSGWDKYNINRVDYKLALKSLLNVMLDQQTGMLVPFDYKFI